MSQITTLTLFKFTSIRSKLWAFAMMQFAHAKLKKVQGQEFYKLLGTGKEGFNPYPDFNTYGLLQIWNNEESAFVFFKAHPIVKRYEKKSSERYTLFLKNIMARGAWNGSNPFKKSTALTAIPQIAVITRATIKTKFLVRFWNYVPKSQQNLNENRGLLYTKGIGELPFKNMATFSIWENIDALNKFAYQTAGHVSAIGKTRELQWYSEELFSRFQPYKSEGSWGGIDFLGLPGNRE